MNESDLMRSIMLECGSGLVRLFRNNVGICRFPDGSVVKYGLCKGSSDLIGFKSVIVTPAMVGMRLAVFVALETKSKRGVATSEQENFIEVVNDLGGISGIIRSVTEAKLLLGD